MAERPGNPGFVVAGKSTSEPTDWPKTLRSIRVVHKVLNEKILGDDEEFDLHVINHRVAELLTSAEERITELREQVTEALGREPSEPEMVQVLEQNLVQAIGLVSVLFAALPEWMQQAMRDAITHLREHDTDDEDDDNEDDDDNYENEDEETE